jgi:hypothetical protein
MTNVTDSNILEELEYRGIQSLLSEMQHGLTVPTCFAARVKRIVKRSYDIDLVEGTVYEKTEGSFCLMPYNDTRVDLSFSY